MELKLLIQHILFDTHFFHPTQVHYSLIAISIYSVCSELAV